VRARAAQDEGRGDAVQAPQVVAVHVASESKETSYSFHSCSGVGGTRRFRAWVNCMQLQSPTMSAKGSAEDIVRRLTAALGAPIIIPYRGSTATVPNVNSVSGSARVAVDTDDDEAPRRCCRPTPPKPPPPPPPVVIVAGRRRVCVCVGVGVGVGVGAAHRAVGCSGDSGRPLLQLRCPSTMLPRPRCINEEHDDDAGLAGGACRTPDPTIMMAREPVCVTAFVAIRRCARVIGVAKMGNEGVEKQQLSLAASLIL
jgi:hypothetical protein